MNAILIRPMSDAEIDAVNGGLILELLALYGAFRLAYDIGYQIGQAIGKEPEVLVPNLFP